MQFIVHRLLPKTVCNSDEMFETNLNFLQLKIHSLSKNYKLYTKLKISMKSTIRDKNYEDPMLVAQDINDQSMEAQNGPTVTRA